MKLCKIAEGVCNLYLSTGIRGGLWDFCSGEVIVSEAGGFVSDLNGNPMDYLALKMRECKTVLSSPLLKLFKKR